MPNLSLTPAHADTQRREPSPTPAYDDTPKVAKWGFGGINTVSLFNFTYNDTVLAYDGVTKIVAPGTGGVVNFRMESGVSEVDSKIDFTITETNAGAIPIVYQVGTNYYSSVLAPGSVYLKKHGEAALSEVTITGNLAAMGTYLSSLPFATVGAGKNYSTAVGTVNWFWAFESDATNDTGADTSDPALGTAAADGSAIVTLNVSVKAVQID